MSHTIPLARRARGLLLIAALIFAAPAALASGELQQYVETPDASYGWREVGKGRIGDAEYAELILTSHTWRGVPWKHLLLLIRPENADPDAKQAFLFIHGGRWRAEYEGGLQKLPREARILERLAGRLRAPVALLAQVPFQPMFERREDALIAYTFDHYLKTGESDWPLLLPMVKAAARGMDAVQEFTESHWKMDIQSFTVAGASKRGWTSWLTAAVDPRVASVAPMVIDMLNLPAQIALQRETFGDLSEEVRDYADIGLPERIDSERGRQLLQMVDPFSYRHLLTLPKLIMLGTNDRYWPLDALKLYWNELPEPKRVLYLPNQGHGIRDFDRIIGALSALHRYSARGEAMPQMTWKFSSAPGGIELQVSTDRPSRRVVAWTAKSATRDFREARWESHTCRRINPREHLCRRPTDGESFSALYAEAEFQDAKQPRFALTSTVCVSEPGGASGC